MYIALADKIVSSFHSFTWQGKRIRALVWWSLLSARPTSWLLATIRMGQAQWSRINNPIRKLISKSKSCTLYLKFQIIWEGHKSMKKRYPGFFSNFMAFSHYRTFNQTFRFLSTWLYKSRPFIAISVSKIVIYVFELDFLKQT